MPQPQGSIRSEALTVLSATLTGAAAATTVTLTRTGYPACAAFRVKRLASSTGNIRWGRSDDTVDANNGYLLTAADPSSDWIPAQNDAIKVYAVTSNADYEIMRLS